MSITTLPEETKDINGNVCLKPGRAPPVSWNRSVVEQKCRETEVSWNRSVNGSLALECLALAQEKFVLAQEVKVRF
jgi:hypothetical protein